MDNLNFDIQSNKDNYFESEIEAYIKPPKKIILLLAINLLLHIKNLALKYLSVKADRCSIFYF